MTGTVTDAMVAAAIRADREFRPDRGMDTHERRMRAIVTAALAATTDDPVFTIAVPDVEFFCDECGKRHLFRYRPGATRPGGAS